MKDKDKIATALDILEGYGDIDGAYHKMWVLDQVARTLLGNKAYKKWIKSMEASGYEWDEGIAP